MFERFTERARQVVVLAQEEARTLKHDYIGTEHILLGLLRVEDGLAARALENLDVTIERVRGQVVRIVGSGQELTSGQIPLTPRAKKVLELALREALSLGHNYIGTEHILLGLVRHDEGVAVRILLDFDADSEKIRGEVIHMLSGPGAGPRVVARMVEAGFEEDQPGWQPGLQWEAARIDWTPAGPELLVPLRLERRAVALFDTSPVWGHGELASVEHEAERGLLRVRGASLLESVDPAMLRHLLDDALQQAHKQAAELRARESALAEAFLAALRDGWRGRRVARSREIPPAPKAPLNRALAARERSEDRLDRVRRRGRGRDVTVGKRPAAQPHDRQSLAPRERDLAERPPAAAHRYQAIARADQEGVSQLAEAARERERQIGRGLAAIVPGQDAEAQAAALAGAARRRGHRSAQPATDHDAAARRDQPPALRGQLADLRVGVRGPGERDVGRGGQLPPPAAEDPKQRDEQVDEVEIEHQRAEDRELLRRLSVREAG